MGYLTLFDVEIIGGIAIAAIANGSMKCSAKNRVRVALSTANPPHTH